VCHSNLLQIKFIFGGTSEKFGEKMFLDICYKVLSEKQLFLKPLKVLKENKIIVSLCNKGLKEKQMFLKRLK
jgi:hypothetical protein